MADNHSHAEIDALKREIPLWRIATNRLGKFQRENGNWTFTCPWHKNGQERTPSFKVYVKDGTWLYKCFGCGETGNVIQFVQKMDRLDFKAAVEKLRTELDGTATFQPIVEADQKAGSFPLDRMKTAETALENSTAARQWLANRGINRETAKQFHLGFVQSAEAVSKDHPLADKGWILIPTINENGDITLLKYRSIVGKDWLRKSGMATTIFNLPAINPFEDVFLTEGPFDAMVLTQAGYTAVSLDNAQYNPSPEERDRLTQAQNLFLAGDMDTPGQAAMDKLWSEFRDRTYKIQWPNGVKDANEFFLKCGNVEKFKAEIERLKQVAREQPMPYVYSMSETMQRMDTGKPLDDPARLRFPWAQIDKWTAIVPGDVMMLSAGDTKCGKSTWLMNVLLHNAIKYGKTVVNYTAEMSPQQYARRAVAYLVPANRDNLSDADFKTAMDKLRTARFYNGYKPGADYKAAIDLLKWAKRRLGADILVVDPLSFLIRGARQYEQEGDAMRLLKDLATEYHVIVIAVSQPRKGLPSQKNREMIGQDIGGSYTQSTDASQVFLLHRDRLSNTMDGTEIFAPETKVKLEYSRESSSRVTRLWFEGKTATFFPLESQTPIEQEADHIVGQPNRT